jgi:hypothetical protein
VGGLAGRRLYVIGNHQTWGGLNYFNVLADRLPPWPPPEPPSPGSGKENMMPNETWLSAPQALPVFIPPNRSW